MKIMLLLVLPLLVAKTYAFDAWGFHSGMSIPQAAAVGQRAGYEVREPPALNDPNVPRFHTLSFVNQGANGKDQLGYVASFCDGRLTWISHDYLGNIGNLFELLNELKATYGAPTAETTSTMWTDARARGIDFNYPPKLDDVTYIAANLTTNTDTKFGIQVIHHLSDMHCN